MKKVPVSTSGGASWLEPIIESIPLGILKRVLKVYILEKLDIDRNTGSIRFSWNCFSCLMVM